MEFKFDANQQFQTDAIEAVADLFEGQPRIEHEHALDFALGVAFTAMSNRLDLDANTLLDNLRAVQEKRNLPSDNAVQCIEETIETANGQATGRFPNFSVEMETGTGKTYVYVRTALELFRRYGFRKFIVVVPSVAVREGVLKTFSVTRRHLLELYDNTPYRYYAYDSISLSQVRQFVGSESVEFMVMTLDSFNKAANVIRQETDRLQGETPIHLIQAARPILILDEPQNMESEKSVAALATLAPLFALRYSATHRNPYNLVYRLTPFDAYRQGLVKRIEVASVVKDDDFNQVFLRVDDIKAQGKSITAKVAVHVLMKDGSIKEKVVTVKPGDSLQEKTNRPTYANFRVDEINLGSGAILFTNGMEIKRGASQGADKDALFEAQIRYTIEEHFRKQARLQNRGIKILSLFFIDRVANYAEDGIIRRLFDKTFNELKSRYEGWTSLEPATVQAAYFARQQGSKGGLEDSTTGAAKKDEEAYDLIMRDKERLLSFGEPVSFLFSHSALREGWDNPNVFQICTLNQSISEMKKRQEIGRGVRLAVNQQGDRIREEEVNILTVVANESYDKYVATLQQEIEAEYGTEGAAPKPVNARKRELVRLRKHYMLRPEFRELWDRIKQKTRYAVQVDSERLIQQVVEDLEKVAIKAPRITATKAVVSAEGEDRFRAFAMSGTKDVLDLSGRTPLPNLIDIMAHLLEYTTPPVLLSRRTLVAIVKRTTNKELALANPHQFATAVVQIIKTRLADQLVDGIQYEKINEWYEMTRFADEIETWENLVVPGDYSLYDHVICDSVVERKFVEGLESRKDIKLYIKLPSWFTVPTPVGEYNPDWAIVKEDRDEHGDANGNDLLYFVRETKASKNLDELRPDERRKIICGEKHFADALGTPYSVGPDVADLP